MIYSLLFDLRYPLLVQEYHDGLYSVFSYFFARSASYLPLFTLDGMVLISTSYWMIGLVQTLPNFLTALGLPRFLKMFLCMYCQYLVIALLIEQSAVAFGIMISAISPSYPVAISVTGPILTILSIVGGLYANIGELPSYISWVCIFNIFI